MIRTRVGYAGGTAHQPTYQDLGDHTEAIQVDFDPTVISYEELLDVFWQSHNPERKSWSRQYATFVLTHDREQAKLAFASREKLGPKVVTDIRPAGEFWRAEGYHQKYRLRHRRELHDALVEHFGSDRAFVDSTEAARINGLLGGWGSEESLDVPAHIAKLLP
ncbi:MAG: peptide-methionine (S)-S-oxide reductase MsrA [Planctomycetota bacterium]